MSKLPADPAVEFRDGAPYLAGSRISLASLAVAVGRGETLDGILADFPVIKSRDSFSAAVTYIQTHRTEVEAYLSEHAQRWEQATHFNPVGLTEKAAQIRKNRNLRSA